ncbi:MAG: sel1 repeat family protein [Sulfuricurvum sp.]|uniref:tetratricopeptide repeat protein n=1 Tax=Sulfuricurvum sp. TaxID=2025608 RepID=UPI0025D34A85|nr:tetratricopeptide repeat protein [Sulfuricurvum sp.]MBV5321172.1 sel1 repeat family protein [Sulfuricurvum sp.]
MKSLFTLLMVWVSLHSAEQESFWETYTAALRGDKVAQFQTGVIYERGIGLEANQTRAAEWYLKSANQGYLDAQFNVAIMYVRGRGVDYNVTQGMMWLAAAAKQGDKESRKLLLEVIDGKYDKSLKPTEPEKIKIGEITAITGIRMKTNRDTMICDQSGNCSAIKAYATVTSRAKSGEYYKVSGIGGKKGWEPYENEGWIHERDVQRD